MIPPKATHLIIRTPESENQSAVRIGVERTWMVENRSTYDHDILQDSITYRMFTHASFLPANPLDTKIEGLDTSLEVEHCQGEKTI